MEAKVCASCRHENNSSNYFCTDCGSKLIPDEQIRSRLYVVHGEPKGARFLIRKGRNTIGHDCGNLIVLGDEHISNKHAAIVFEDERYWVEDRNSKNGVYLNGKKVRRERLANGSIIKLGSTLLRFENKDEA
jgi:pSer/pThr/pTyr-binding forkhead associated (FHA) protein